MLNYCYTHLRRYALESLTHVGRAAQASVRMRARARLQVRMVRVVRVQGEGERAGVGEVEGQGVMARSAEYALPEARCV